MHLFAQVELLLLLMSGNVFNIGQDPVDEFMDIVLSITLIIMVIVFFIIWFIMTIKVLLKLFQTSQSKLAIWCRGNRFTRHLWIDNLIIESDGTVKRINKTAHKQRGKSLIGDQFIMDRRIHNRANTAAVQRKLGIDDDAELMRNPLWAADIADGAASEIKNTTDFMSINPMFTELQEMQGKKNIYPDHTDSDNEYDKRDSQPHFLNLDVLMKLILIQYIYNYLVIHLMYIQIIQMMMMMYHMNMFMKKKKYILMLL